MAMLSLEQDFPDIADQIVLAADSHSALKDALVDYEHACKRMRNTAIEADERVQWAEIHAELVIEIRRLFDRLDR